MALRTHAIIESTGDRETLHRKATAEMNPSSGRLDRIEAILAQNATQLAENATQLAELTRRQAGLAETVDLIGAMQTKSEERMHALEGHMATLMVTMDRLANIVIRREERLDSLDGGDT